ncbi:MAG: hypothetical protein WCI55_09080 [Armatimonadota bacterium]
MKTASLLLVLGAIVVLSGCASSEGGDGGKETSVADAKQKIDSKMSSEEQSELASKVKAWDPKKDKK